MILEPLLFIDSVNYINKGIKTLKNSFENLYLKQVLCTTKDKKITARVIKADDNYLYLFKNGVSFYISLAEIVKIDVI